MTGRASSAPAPAVAAVVVGCAGLVTACFGTPTPLAPSLGGSVGVPHHGVLTSALQLPVRGPGYVRYRHRSSNYWGTPQLVRTLQQAAAHVHQARPGGAPLVVGDIAGPRGGKIPRHRSHRTGRDVDLLFYVTTPAGVPVRSPGFLRFDADGLARVHADDDVFLRFDVERNWLLVKALLSDETTGVQWLFISHQLEALLIDYARARGEDLALVWHAETVLHQPGDSSPHDDHFHVRIACSPQESVAGCEGGGPYWEWLPALPALGPLTPEQQEAIASDDPLEPRTPGRPGAS